MKILMINPPYYYPEVSGATKNAYKRISYPMGLMALSSALKRIDILGDPVTGTWSSRGDCGSLDENGGIIKDVEDREIMLIDCPAEGFGDPDGEGDRQFSIRGFNYCEYGLSEEAMIEKIESAEFAPDIIMIAGMFSKNLDQIFNTSKALKEQYPEAKIIAGGIAMTDLDKMPTTFGKISDELIDHERQAKINYMNDPFDSGIDIIVRGEGEITAVRLANAIEVISNKRMAGEAVTEREEFEILSQIPNIVMRPSEALKEDIPSTELHYSGVYTTPRKNEIASPEDIDALPFEDVEVNGLNRSNYSAEKFHAGTAKSNNWIDLHTSRGCDKQCTFCAVQPYFGCFKPLSEERVAQKLKYLKDHNFDEICIHDDSILNDPERAVNIFKMIGKGDEGAGIPGFNFEHFSCIGGIEFMPLLFKNQEEEPYYINRMAVDSRDVLLSQEQFDELPEHSKGHSVSKDLCYKLVDGREIIDAMSENGCYKIYLAMESANPETLKEIGKSRIFPEEHLRSEHDAISYLAQSGIETHGGMMMGHPKTEGINELMENVRFCRDMRELGLSRVAFWPYSALPGSNLSTVQMPYERFSRVREDFGNAGFSFETTNLDSYAQGWTAEELITVIRWANDVLNDDTGRNWIPAEGKTVLSAAELEDEIGELFYNDHRKPDGNKIKQLTETRLKEQFEPRMLELYREAVGEVRSEHEGIEPDQITSMVSEEMDENVHSEDLVRELGELGPELG